MNAINSGDNIFANSTGAVKFDRSIVEKQDVKPADTGAPVEDVSTITFDKAPVKEKQHPPKAKPEEKPVEPKKTAIPQDKKADTITYSVGGLGTETKTSGSPGILFIEDPFAGQEDLKPSDDIGDVRMPWTINLRPEAAKGTEFFTTGLNSIGSAKDGLFTVDGEKI